MNDKIEVCDICNGKFNNIKYDARTSFGPWANMCQCCFQSYGVGLGLGKGQKYEKKNGQWIKTEG